ncbi:Smr/MutS family protein [Croceibacterium sp. TMG7-5b_MA50]|uniref:Smr/MutS family protein n=1 Tax=Croceibacterium sp. TMG7-5b_MA50 TaxID=3121290 RepID=UPI00322219CA
MARPPRGLTAGEQAAWSRLAHSVTPLPGRRLPPRPVPAVEPPATPSPPPPPGRAAPPAPSSARGHTPPLAQQQGLDAGWDRRLARAAIAPDFTIDLHGHTLDQAYTRLHMGIGQAHAMGARLVLLVTGRPRPADPADRGTSRGAIRAKVLDWLAAGPHASDVVAIRNAHRRHGGDGALYLVLRRQR